MKDGDIVTCPSCFGKKEFKRCETYNSGMSLTSWVTDTITTPCSACKGVGKMKVSLKYLPIEERAVCLEKKRKP